MAKSLPRKVKVGFSFALGSQPFEISYFSADLAIKIHLYELSEMDKHFNSSLIDLED